MGHRLSIDKYTTDLVDLLAISPYYYKKVKLDKIVSPSITQHLKIWKFRSNEINSIDINPIPLSNLQNNGFVFSSKEAYLVLLVYRANSNEKMDVVSFPHSLWGLVQSADNLTPRGLSNSFSSDDETSTTHTLDSFLLSKRENKEYYKNREYKYMLFVWNGKQAGSLLKAKALSRGFELDTLLNKSGDSLLSFIFNGGVVRGIRLQRGKVLLFDQASSDQDEEQQPENPNSPDTERMLKTYETVYLFRFLVPETYVQDLQSNLNETPKSVIEQTMYPKFRKYFFPESQEEVHKEDLHNSDDYQRRFKFIQNSSSDGDDENDVSDDSKNLERPPPQSNPVPKLAFGPDLIKGQPAQKPAIPLLNIPPKEPKGSEEEVERENLELNKPKVPGIKGIALDVSQVQRKPILDDYDISSDRIYEDSGEYSSSRASNNPGKGISLDLTKAKKIQNEILNQNDKKAPQMPVLGLPGGNISERKVPSLGIPVSSGSRSGEGDSSNRVDYDQMSGPQLTINIKNVTKLSDDTDMKEEEDLYEPPQFKRGCCEPDPPSSHNSTDDADFFMAKNTSIAEERNNRFKQICSEIIDEFLYLGSDYLAKNKDVLKQNKITHVINAVGDYSPNYHGDDFKYLSFHLKDHPRENIEWIFYKAIKFIEEAKETNGRVYVHWVQGISRSATICLAYVILSLGLNYNEAFEYIQKRREVINPNLGFIVQLMWFHKRIYNSFDSIPVNPRVFTVWSHEKEAPMEIVAKLNMEQFFVEKQCKPMDPRGVYIIQTKEEFIVLIGSECKDKNREKYHEYAYQYIEILQTKEKAATKITEYEQENVDQYFWSIWGLEKTPATPFAQSRPWDYWFPCLEDADKISNIPMVHQIDTYNEEVKQEKKLKPRLFTYPDTDISSAVFDEEDLDFDELNIICQKVMSESPSNKPHIYIYEGDSFEERAGLRKQDYIEKVIQKFFEGVRREDVIVKECLLGEEIEGDFFSQ